MPELLRTDQYGPVYKLIEPYTVDGLREDAAHFVEHGRSRLCRLIGCKMRVVGTAWWPKDDEVEEHGWQSIALIAVANTDALDVRRCERCRRVQERRRV